MAVHVLNFLIKVSWPLIWATGVQTTQEERTVSIQPLLNPVTWLMARWFVKAAACTSLIVGAEDGYCAAFRECHPRSIMYWIWVSACCTPNGVRNSSDSVVADKCWQRLLLWKCLVEVLVKTHMAFRDGFALKLFNCQAVWGFNAYIIWFVRVFFVRSDSHKHCCWWLIRETKLCLYLWKVTGCEAVLESVLRKKVVQKKVHSLWRDQGERSLAVCIIFSMFFLQVLYFLACLSPQGNRPHIQCIFSVHYRS